MKDDPMPTTDQLQRQFGLGELATVTAGEGGLAKVVVTAPGATAEVYLHGAHVTAYQPIGQQPVLFVSRQSRYESAKAIRGGVPICFPWFGPLENRPQAPAHGFVRTRGWTLAGIDHADGAVTVRLTTSGDGSDANWPHAFRADYAITVGPRLTTALTVTHVAGESFLYEAALHTYLHVGDVRRVRVSGLENTPWRDKVLAREMPGVDDPVTFDDEVDRVYIDTAAPVTVDDPHLNRRLTVTKHGSDSTVVWNPWTEKAHALPDLGDDEWPHFVCVETANVGGGVIVLSTARPSHTTAATLSIAPLP